MRERKECRLITTIAQDHVDQEYANAVAWYLALSPSAKEYLSSALIARFPHMGLTRQFETEHFTTGTRALLYLEQIRRGAAGD
jgi:hypothetical protein